MVLSYQMIVLKIAVKDILKEKEEFVHQWPTMKMVASLKVAQNFQELLR